MRKSFFIAPILALALAAMLFVANGSSQSRAEGLQLVSPAACPNGGCAAGQRLNFTVEFAVGEGNGICVYAPTDWVETGSTAIIPTGKISAATYNLNSVTFNSFCANNTDSNEVFLAGASSTISSGGTDQLDFNLNIDSSSTDDGYLKVKVVGTGETPTNIIVTFSSVEIGVSGLVTPVYVADTPADCGSYDPCFVNTLEDELTGIGTGLRDAVRAVSSSSTIHILGNYPVKTNTVLIDKSVILSGHLDSKITYTGNDCGQPMLSVTSGAAIQSLTIDDGACTSPSRTLVQVNSPSDVQIEHNSLANGKYAVDIKNNTGNVQVAFNEIFNNSDYAILTAAGTTGELWVYANNITDNGTLNQVLCNSGTGHADHNFWGEDELAENNVEGCSVTNGKQLGASILASSGGPGVEALLTTVTNTKSYLFNSNKLAVHHTSGADYNLVVVNHGQGANENIPFLTSVGDSIQPCSNFYDLFTVNGSTPSDLVLAMKYDLNQTCLSTIESSDYCGGTNSAKYPLWWYDPANNVTDGWDTTGQSPEGSGAGGAQGQTTSCNTAANEILVTIDHTGRPALSNDLSFTPFVTGYLNTNGIELSLLNAYFDVTKNEIKWTTTEERGIKGFHILRADSQSEPYSRISPLIESIGDTYIGGIYSYSDTNITFTKTYYYKLEVISDSGDSIETYGPVSVITSTATPTATATRTTTPTRTATLTRTPTPYYYRSPTSYYRPATSTPRGVPTQVRTYGPTMTTTSVTKPPYHPTTQGTSQSTEGYPVDTPVYEATPGYPAEEGGANQTPSPTSKPSEGAYPSGDEPGTDTGSDTDPDADDKGPLTPVRWVYLVIGGACGLVLLGGAGLLLAKTKLI